MAKTVLDQAERMFAHRKYAETVALLEPQVPVYRDSGRFFYLLGSSCLRIGDMGGAWTYLKRSKLIIGEDRNLDLYIGLLHLSRGETDRAIEIYLSVLERFPNDQAAKNGLGAIRNSARGSAQSESERAKLFKQLFPVERRNPKINASGLSTILGVMLCICVIAAATFGIIKVTKSLPARPAIAAIVLNVNDRSQATTTAGTFKYVLTATEVISAFESAKRSFQEYQDNRAIISLNRLLLSNASESVKSKASLLKKFAAEPDFRTVKDVPAFRSVMIEPGLYDGVTVTWKGMAANVRLDGSTTNFDFLVGYEGKKTLDGILRATIANGTIPVDRPLEILGVLHFSSEALTMKVAAVHELISP